MKIAVLTTVDNRVKVTESECKSVYIEDPHGHRWGISLHPEGLQLHVEGPGDLRDETFNYKRPAVIPAGRYSSGFILTTIGRPGRPPLPRGAMPPGYDCTGKKGTYYLERDDGARWDLGSWGEAFRTAWHDYETIHMGLCRPLPPEEDDEN